MPIVATPTDIPDVILLEPKVFRDGRGSFFESFNRRDFETATHERADFVQDNHSTSGRGVLRGLHYQIQHPQGKLIRVVRGEIFDVAVDLRRGSRTYGKGVGVTLSADDHRQLWIPQGFAHGFLVTSDGAEVLYKTTDYWFPEHERTLLWNDPVLDLRWPLAGPPTLAPRDAAGRPLHSAETFD